MGARGERAQNRVMSEPTVPRSRRVFSVLLLAAAAAEVVVLVAEGPPGSGYGWGSVVVSCVLVAAPLVALAYMVRSPSRDVARWTAVLAAVVAFFVGMALVGNWAGSSTTNRVLDLLAGVPAIGVLVATIVIELPAFRGGRHIAAH